MKAAAKIAFVALTLLSSEATAQLSVKPFTDALETYRVCVAFETVELDTATRALSPSQLVEAAIDSCRSEEEAVLAQMAPFPALRGQFAAFKVRMKGNLIQAIVRQRR